MTSRDVLDAIAVLQAIATVALACTLTWVIIFYKRP